MTNDRKRIRERLARLMRLTVKNGASEAEAVAAAKKAAALMEEHNLTYRSVEEIESEDFCSDRREWFRGRKGRKRCASIPPVRHCLASIDDLCGTMHSYNTHTGALQFFGARHDTECAHYLVLIIAGAIDREWIAYKKSEKPRSIRSARTSFQNAMAYRISARVSRMAEDQSKPNISSTGTDLVAVKNALVKERFRAANPRLRSANVSPTCNDYSAFIGGLAAGDKVPISKGLNEARETKAISSS